MALLRQWDRLVERDGVLFRRVFCPKGGEESLQLILPAVLKRESLTRLHQEHGHQGWYESVVIGLELVQTSNSGAKSVSVAMLLKIQGLLLCLVQLSQGRIQLVMVFYGCWFLTPLYYLQRDAKSTINYGDISYR
ncbi:hypothetical protein AOLI_G00291590 [Acnodon oligacanthus]